MAVLALRSEDFGHVNPCAKVISDGKAARAFLKKIHSPLVLHQVSCQPPHARVKGEEVF